MTQDAAFTEYLAALRTLSELPGHREAALADAARIGRSEVEAQLTALRRLREELAATEDTVQRLSSRAVRLSARTRISLDDVPAASPVRLNVGTVEDVRRVVESLGRDVTAAEDAWGWVERASRHTDLERRQTEALPPAHPATAAAPATAAPPAPQGSRTGVLLGGIAAAAALILVVVLMVL